MTLGSFDGFYVSPANFYGFAKAHARVYGDEHNVLKVGSVSVGGSMVFGAFQPPSCHCINFAHSVLKKRIIYFR